MNVFEEMRAYVGLTDEQQTLLHGFWPVLAPHADRVIDHFYERITAFEGTRNVLENEAQVVRLKGSLRRWVEDTVCGPRDAGYIERRRRIGHVHVEVGLEAHYMHGAMSVMLGDMHIVIMQHYDFEEAGLICDIVTRAFMIDLAMMTSTYVDNREKRRLDELQGLLVNHLALAVLLVDQDGLVVASTPASQALLEGRDPHGLPWAEALPCKLLEAGELAQVVEDARASGHPITISRIDTEDRSFMVHVVPLNHAHASLMFQIEELTEALALESRVRRAESLAQLGALSAAVAHELRNPLAGIRGAIQVIESTLPENAPHRPIMLKVEHEVDRLNELVTDLLTYARPRQPRAERLALRDVVERALTLSVGEVTPVVEGTGDAIGDSDQVSQIVLNLLQNARQAGATEIRIALDHGRVQISDDGPGIPPAQRENIFEAFVTTKAKGTGLGLAISRRAAGGMGGWLEVVDGPLTGATFALTLPHLAAEATL